jgi:hypothetical protein
VQIDYLRRFFDGDAFVLGPITGDHWFVFISDHCERPAAEYNDCTLDVRRALLACRSRRVGAVPVLCGCRTHTPCRRRRR